MRAASDYLSPDPGGAYHIPRNLGKWPRKNRKEQLLLVVAFQCPVASMRGGLSVESGDAAQAGINPSGQEYFNQAAFLYYGRFIIRGRFTLQMPELMLRDGFA
jgi:hypothetical protein